MADAPRKKRTFKKFQYRGMDLETMTALSNEVTSNTTVSLLLGTGDLTRLSLFEQQEFSKHVNARQRRRMNRGLQRKCNTLMVRIKADMKKAPPGERPDGVKTHVRRLVVS
jgi:small subunit ribosomal protein S15e